MTSNSNRTLERIARRIPVPEPAYQQILRRRDRKGRNQRILAGTVGIAVFVSAVWIVTTGVPFDQSRTEVVPGGTGTGSGETGPTLTGPTVPPDAEQWDGSGLPPQGAVPSTPETGELVAQYIGGPDSRFGYVFVYADGRVIWRPGATGVLNEQYLTPDGVDLLVSGDVEPRRFLEQSDGSLVASEVFDVAGAWEDPEIKPHVPSRYAVCYFVESGRSNPGTINAGFEYPSTVVEFFPAPARAILRGEVTHGEVGDPNDPECSAVTTEEARALDEMLSEAGLSPAPADWAAAAWFLREDGGDRLGIYLMPLLPDGVGLRVAG